MKEELLNTVEQYLFSSVEELQKAKIPQPQRDRLFRLREMYFFWREHPRMAERDVVAEIRRRYKLGLSSAYEDVRLIKMVVGKMTQTPIEYHRWQFLAKFDQTWEMAVLKQDTRTMERLLNTYGKYTRLGEDEKENIPYSDIIPPFLEITTDATVAGFKPLPNAREIAAKLEKRYIQEIEQISTPKEVRFIT